MRFIILLCLMLCSCGERTQVDYKSLEIHLSKAMTVYEDEMVFPPNSKIIFKKIEVISDEPLSQPIEIEDGDTIVNSGTTFAPAKTNKNQEAAKAYGWLVWLGAIAMLAGACIVGITLKLGLGWRVGTSISLAGGILTLLPWLISAYGEIMMVLLIVSVVPFIKRLWNKKQTKTTKTIMDHG